MNTGHAEGDTESDTKARPSGALLLISALIGLTVTRVMAITFLPELERNGGEAPDAWLGPWVTDGVLGVLIPIAIFAVLRGRGARVWGALLIYNALGAFDYVNGLVTQWLDPLPASVAPPGLVVGSLVVTLAAQTTVLALLLRSDVVRHFVAGSGPPTQRGALGNDVQQT